MPLMQACFTRCGEPIHMRVDKMDYLFTETQTGDFVANITDEAHIKHLLQTGNFKMYDQSEAMEAARRAQAKEEAKAKAGSGKK